jgi:hypothetical protein
VGFEENLHLEKDVLGIRVADPAYGSKSVAAVEPIGRSGFYPTS